MASLTTPASPGSLQLRFGLRWRESSSSAAVLRIRFRPSDDRRRVRLVLAVGEAADDGGGRSRSRAGPNGSPDSFAGWEESGEGEAEKKGGGYGGILGAGLAGVFFVAGVTFAALSFSSRSSSGGKQQMKPLTAEQEMLISSKDTSAKVDQVEIESNGVVVETESKSSDHTDNEAGINKDFSTSTEINQEASESRYTDVYHMESASRENIEAAGDAVHKASQDDLQTIPDVNNNPVPQSIIGTPELPEHSVDFSSDVSELKDTHNISSSTLDSVSSHDVNLCTDIHSDVQSPGIDSRNRTINHQEETSNLAETINSETPLDLSSGSERQLPSETLASNLVILESGDVVESQASLEDGVKTATIMSKDQDIGQNDMLQLSAEASTSNPVEHIINEVVPDHDQSETVMLSHDSMISYPEGNKVNESGLPAVNSASVNVYHNENGPDSKTHCQVNSNFVSESIQPEKSFSHAGIPAPSLVSAALQTPPGKVLVPALVDQVQGQALAALQVLKVIEPDVQPGDLCTRREYARWLVTASSALSRNTVSKVYPAMYIENVSELAFDDVTPEDRDFPYIQGLAEAGLISSKLSRSDFIGSASGQQDYVLFSPESPLSRQDLVSWKMALEKRQLPEVDRNSLYQCSGYLDIDKINTDAWPALVADLSAGEQGITALAFGYTRLFQPDKPVTKAQAAIALATGDAAEVVSEELARIEAESLAETAVNAHAALVAQVEKDLNASFEKELAKEREKIEAMEKLAEEARRELERLRAEKEEQNNALIRGRAAVESEMEVLSRLRHEVEEQLESLMSNKMEISFERERINKLRKEAESENQVIVQLQYELEVERKALAMARAWAEEEARKAREQARALEEARDRWERHGIKVVVDGELQDDASTGVTWLTAGKQTPVDETISRAESLVEKLKAMAAEVKLRSSVVIERMIEKILYLISALKQRASEASQHAIELKNAVVLKARSSLGEFQESASGLSSTVGERARRIVEDCKEGMERITQKFKT